MRPLFLAAVAAAALTTSGCGPEFQRRMAEQQAAQAAYATSPDGRAEALCEYQADAAYLGRTGRGFDLEGSYLAGKMQRDCMAIYRATGRVP